MAPGRTRIEINWREVFSSTSPDRDASFFCVASPSSAPQNSLAAAARGPRGAARASSDDEKRRGTPYPTRRFGGLRGELDQRRGERGPGAVADDGVPRRVTRAAAKKVRLPARSCVFVRG